MAAAVFEAIDEGELQWRSIDIAVAPGISAMQAAAARAGAPLGHDFCAISLSDNLKPWPVVEKRLVAAATADFVIALYNPASSARPTRIHQAFALLRSLKAGAIPVIFAHALGREDEQIIVEPLATANPASAGMSTLIIVGSSETRIVARGSGPPFVYTPRGKAPP
jgi:precorrin-3B C17-methyltransferase